MDWIKNNDIAVVQKGRNFYITTEDNYNKEGTDEYDRGQTLAIPNTKVNYRQLETFLTFNFDIPKERLKNHTMLR